MTATDLVLTVTELLRKHGVVGKFVEFFGPGLDHLPLADRATIANMAPEYGATCGFFPVDQITLDYLRLSGRDAGSASPWSRPTARRRACGAMQRRRSRRSATALKLDLASVQPSLAGPKRPQDRVAAAGHPRPVSTCCWKPSGRIQQADSSDVRSPVPTSACATATW